RFAAGCPNCGSLTISLYPFLFSLGYSAKGARFEQGQFSAEKPVPPGSAVTRNQQLNASRPTWLALCKLSLTNNRNLYLCTVTLVTVDAEIAGTSLQKCYLGLLVVAGNIPLRIN